MRAALAVCSFLLFFTGCGYVGPVVPPSPELPNPVADLAVVERGDELAISFTVPRRTTDNLAITRFSSFDLRIGTATTPFDFERWAAAARQYEVAVPPHVDPEDPKPLTVSKSVAAADWVGKRVAIAVRTAIKKSGHFSQWSNRVVLQVIAPLEPPDLKVEATGEGYRLTWPPGGKEEQYQIFRQGPNEHAPVPIGTASAPPFTDKTSQWDTRYTYTVVGKQDSAESLPSAPVSVIHADTFPPAIPANVASLAGPESIEVSWSRSADSDLKGYYVYRSVNGGPFARQGDLINLPVFSDHAVEHGKSYRYAISAVDQKGNESEKSAPTPAITF